MRQTFDELHGREIEEKSTCRKNLLEKKFMTIDNRLTVAYVHKICKHVV